MSDTTNTEATTTKEAPVNAETKPEEKPRGTRREKKEKKPAAEKPVASSSNKQGQGAGKKKDTTLLGVGVKKEEDFSEWYQNIITRAELIDYYDISGCYIMRPWAFAIWEQIQSFIDTEIKKLGVQNVYFPLMVSERALNAEKDHLEGFAPEVAWVTRAGQSTLAEPMAVRPTSETIMYPAYSQWIRSHRDLPLKLNQWANVVRWEFKHPVPFIRQREFLWQEGHTVFATKQEADEEVLQILDIYRRAYEEILAVPVTKGMKTEKEKFAGALYTTTIEAFIPVNGRGVQAATSHCLGQNFSKMFHIEFEDDKGAKQLAWQNSWGFTVRSIGISILVHGDDKGLVLAPKVAPYQAVIIPLHFAGKDTAPVDAAAKELLATLRAAGVRAHLDDRTTYNPGYKYNHWEMKGVPIRVEVGPKDVENKTVVICRRDSGEKETIQQAEIADKVKTRLDDIQKAIFAKALKERDEHVVVVRNWEQFVPALDGKNTCLCCYCDREACEDQIKKRSGEESKNKAEEEKGFRLTGSAKTLCKPFTQPELPEGTMCFAGCGQPAVKWTLFGRSY